MTRRCRSISCVVALALLLLPFTASSEEAPPHGITLRPGVARHLLGVSRSQLLSIVGRNAESVGNGWLRFGTNLIVQLEGERSTRLRVTVPSGSSCSEATAWLGFGSSSGVAPLRRRDRCEWSGISLRHRLAEGVAGRLDLTTGVFEIWLTS
jgi:hypothetical protein